MHYALQSQQKREEMVENMYDNHAVENCQTQCNFDTYSTRKRVPRENFFKLLGYGTPLRHNGLTVVITAVKRETMLAFCVETLSKKCYRKG